MKTGITILFLVLLVACGTVKSTKSCCEKETTSKECKN